MPWTNRLREAAYTSPSGVRQTFTYEDVIEEFSKKTAAFDFADADGTFIQDLGNTGRRFPLRVIFWGDDYDQEADAFLGLLEEKGSGRLETPIYGVRNVVPFGRIRRRDDLKTASNQAIIEVFFWETIGVVFPAAQGDPASEVNRAFQSFNIQAPEQFNNLVDLDSAIETSTFENEYISILDTVSNALDSIAETQADTERRFNAIHDSINNSIDILIGDPLTLAFQTLALIQAPARALTSITARLSAYRNLLDNIIATGTAVLFPGSDSRVPNAFHTNDLYAMGFVTGSVQSVLNTQFDTKVEALTAADELLSQLDDVTVWREDNFDSLGIIDTGEAYQQLLDSVALAAGFLVEISFSLKQERSIVLDRDRTIIDLEGEIYGTVDENLDFLINSNSLTGDEILTIPKGKEIVYYV